MWAASQTETLLMWGTYTQTPSTQPFTTPGAVGAVEVILLRIPVMVWNTWALFQGVRQSNCIACPPHARSQGSVPFLSVRNRRLLFLPGVLHAHRSTTCSRLWKLTSFGLRWGVSCVTCSGAFLPSSVFAVLISGHTIPWAFMCWLHAADAEFLNSRYVFVHLYNFKPMIMTVPWDEVS